MLTANKHSSTPAEPWASDAIEIQASLSVEPTLGLSESVAARRRKQYGPNELRSIKPRSSASILLDQVKSVVIILLVGAAVLSFAFGDTPEGTAILIVIFFNTAIGFTTEVRATRSMEALRKLGRVVTRVRRAGVEVMLPAEKVVPGDIVLLDGGDVVTADMRLIEASKVQVDESTLTGESLPVNKLPLTLPSDTHLHDRKNMLFKGTALTRGAAEAIVVGTGEDTELGEISRLVARANTEETPLEKQLDSLGRRLVWATLIIAVCVAAIGLITGRDTFLAIEVAIALAVAAIPEGLPVVATIALARGMWRMAKRNALVSRLSAVETLGATNIILTDKTGTLTENRMTLSDLLLCGVGHLTVTGSGLSVLGLFERDQKEISAAETTIVNEFLTAIVLCNNASVSIENDVATPIGDPTEVALLVAAAKLEIYREEQILRHPELREESFTSESQMMATFNGATDDIRVNVKGAPEAVINCCTSVRTQTGTAPLAAEQREGLLEQHARLAKKGYRVLAVASKSADSIEDIPYADLTLLGTLGLVDPPRPGVHEALERCRAAGVSVVMVTGDHLATAMSIGAQLGIVEAHQSTASGLDGRLLNEAGDDSFVAGGPAAHAKVIARVSPQQKLKIIAMHQRMGNVVAMTGDGVNDAPALKQADIGVAMGLRGTQVAKDAADMVLLDDDFSSIVAAIEQGRAIFANIRKFIVYLLSCNISEVLVVAIATAAAAPLPLLPLQILFLNLVTDVFPALALGVGKGATDLMKREPRSATETLVTRQQWAGIAAYGMVMSIAVLGAMQLSIHWLKIDGASTTTISFLTLAFAQLWHVFNMRDQSSTWFKNEIVSNKWVWLAILFCIFLLLAATYTPSVSRLLSLEAPGLAGWSIVLSMSSLPLLLGPFARKIAAHRFFTARAVPP